MDIARGLITTVDLILCIVILMLGAVGCRRPGRTCLPSTRTIRYA